MLLNIDINCNSQRLIFCNLMNSLNYFNDLWQHDYFLEYFLYYFFLHFHPLLDLFCIENDSVSLNLDDLDLSRFDRNFMNDLFDDFSCDVLFDFRKYLFDLFFVYLDLNYLFNLCWNLFYLINNASDWHCSVCLYLHCDLFVVNQMLGSADVFYFWSVDYFVHWHCHYLIDDFVHDFVFLQIYCFRNFDSLDNFDNFFPF